MQETALEVAKNYDTLKYIGIGLCSIGMAGAAIAIGNIFGSFFNSLARNPSAAPKIEKYIYIAVGLAEAMGIFAVLLAFMIMFK
ncbi:MAG: F0F1 ATP synthase subunit C [Alphaproteobacteria bacterium RIFCSPLOWO2_01_FULL_40_26]|nr:MAG: F0F1 ATP synthase subunit C [Alphaproteobacteria bacterium RIFCSPHIGHO2_02_FULL_40_34]OFW86854.1 MAG: F0F1 ATP synthase subunit C [Alphaproteobacteria bacterium RIFCSPHIGHO2_01_FULL_40_8]OFW94236.1 MAG: F0F1 ATP synthase subunit C [Alphaproteobacteria bacterium RIFCSPLOWO2_01_FULL_40_26]OFX09805.1 MAG: F0F1 ATP synthase subunit C [Alphaproteobacteria bacterium RIFCSPLOWO2_02_FULL_40_19]OFX12254.1 MAG: F0F1 ATP synthase subunit C [Alphaproteobacteria bacterium RIFCSPLOWO2_12_FULL_40_11]